MAADLTAYREALDALFARTTGASKLGLERTESLLLHLGNPHTRYPSLHIAGTNGKGSVVAMLEAMLGAQALLVGKYTSPHLVDFRERIVVGGEQMPGEYVVAFLDRWMPEIEQIGATFFEATTAMAFAYFAEMGVDVAVVETGLGGRLDATNVLTPRVAAVTSIALDHIEYLGDSLEAIAVEKAGIFKPGVPAVVGEPAVGLRHLLANEARARGAAPVRVVADEARMEDVQLSPEGTRFALERRGVTSSFFIPLVGRFQAQNAAVALTTLEACGAVWSPEEAIVRAALSRVRVPGRFQREGKFIFDVAHNPDGIRTLVETLDTLQPPRPVLALLTVLADKDWRQMMRRLAGAVDAFVLTTAPTAPASRAWDLAQAASFARENGWRALMIGDFDAALDTASDSGATVLVTGSFHTVGDALTRLQGSSVTP